MNEVEKDYKCVLILTSRYLPKPSANGLIIDHITKEMIARGYKVICLSVGRIGEKEHEIIDDISIYRVSPSKYSQLQELDDRTDILNKIILKLSKIARKVKIGLLLWKFPDFDISQDKKVFRTINEILKFEKVDCIIGSYKPFSNIAALKMVKRKYHNIKCGVLYLDLIDSMKKPWYMPRFIYDYLIDKSNLDVIENMNFVLIPPQGEKLFFKKEFNQHKDRIYNFHFPTLLNMGNMIFKNRRIQFSNCIKIMYAGTLDEVYRNPEKLLNLLEKAADKIGNIEFNIYGFNNCEKILEKYSGSKLKIINNGIVSHEVVVESMLISNFVVNVGNRTMEAVPSKIFELFSTGKPIINLVNDKNDVTKEYFDIYPCSFEIKAYENTVTEIDNFVDFLLHEKDNNVDIEEISRMFYKNTPAHTVDTIDYILGN